jgi:hypothetical protein
MGRANLAQSIGDLIADAPRGIHMEAGAGRVASKSQEFKDAFSFPLAS